MDLDVSDTVQQISIYWTASSKVDYSKLSNPCFGGCPSHLTDSICGTLSSKYPRIGVFKHQWVGQMDLDVSDTVQQISMHWIASSKVDNPNVQSCDVGYCPANEAIHVLDGVSHI